MRLKFFFVLVFAIIVSITGCRLDLKKDKNKILDLEDLLDAQVRLLSTKDLKLKKETIIGDSIENFIISPDSAGWARELSIFKTADINKPGLLEFYDKKVVEIGNTEKEEYVLLDSNQSETMYLQINKNNESGVISSIEALQHIKNPIYQSRRKLVLIFSLQINDAIHLDSFAIEGYQKMILQDSIIYFTAGKILTE